MINLIYACDLLGAIGKDNKLPWHIPEDLKRFKELTSDSIVVMGRKTYESLPTYPKGLPNRRNVVLSNTISSDPENGIEVVRSLEALFFSTPCEENIWVIGGAEVYKAAIKYADNVYQTLIDTKVNGADTWFKIDEYPQFNLVSNERIGSFEDPNQLCFWYLVYKKEH